MNTIHMLELLLFYYFYFLNIGLAFIFLISKHTYAGAAVMDSQGETSRNYSCTNLDELMN